MTVCMILYYVPLYTVLKREAGREIERQGIREAEGQQRRYYGRSPLTSCIKIIDGLPVLHTAPRIRCQVIKILNQLGINHGLIIQRPVSRDIASPSDYPVR